MLFLSEEKKKSCPNKKKTKTFLSPLCFISVHQTKMEQGSQNKLLFFVHQKDAYYFCSQNRTSGFVPINQGWRPSGVSEMGLEKIKMDEKKKVQWRRQHNHDFCTRFLFVCLLPKGFNFSFVWMMRCGNSMRMWSGELKKQTK